MQSHQDLFETLEEAEKYISEIFDDVYERIDSDDPEECPYDLVNDEYDIYIKRELHQIHLREPVLISGLEGSCIQLLLFIFP